MSERETCGVGGGTSSGIRDTAANLTVIPIQLIFFSSQYDLF